MLLKTKLPFKNIPEQFVQINNERLSLTFKLTPADNKEILLPNKSTVITSKKQCFLTLKRVLFDGDSNAFEIEEKIKRGGRTYEFLPFKAELTLIKLMIMNNNSYILMLILSVAGGAKVYAQQAKVDTIKTQKIKEVVVTADKRKQKSGHHSTHCRAT